MSPARLARGVAPRPDSARRSAASRSMPVLDVRRGMCRPACAARMSMGVLSYRAPNAAGASKHGPSLSNLQPSSFQRLLLFRRGMPSPSCNIACCD